MKISGLMTKKDNRESCVIYFPRAQKFISLTNEDGEVISKIYELVKQHPKLIDLHIYDIIKTEEN